MKRILFNTTIAVVSLQLFALFCFGRNNNPITVVVQKDAALQRTDTVRFTYQTRFDTSPGGGIKKLVTYDRGTPAVLRYTPGTAITRLTIFVAGESQKNIGECYAEPGDSIVIKVSGTAENTTATFTGKGASKYRLQWQLDSITRSALSFVQKESYVPINLQTTLYKFALLRDEKLRFLEKVKPDLSPLAYEIYKEEINSTYWANGYGQCSFYLLKSDYLPAVQQVAEWFIQQGKNVAYPNAQFYSEAYLKSLLNKSRLVLTLATKKYENEIALTYEELKNANKGVMLQEVLYYYLSRLPKGSSEEYTACLEDALQIVTAKEAKANLKKLLEARGVGAKAFNFAIKDTNDKIVKLSDFKGKVVLLDFWFTECPACISLSELMEKEVLPKYKDRDDLVYITVNVDKEKDKWLNSIASGKYTSAKSINLHVEGPKSNSEIIKRYKISAYPTLIIITKDGRMQNANLKSDSKEIIDHINRVL